MTAIRLFQFHKSGDGFMPAAGLFLAAGLIVCCAAGCSKKPDLTPAVSASTPAGGVLSEEERVQGVGNIHIEEPVSAPQEGVAILARAKGNILQINIRNDRAEPLFLHPKQFGVIVQGVLYRVETGKVNMRLFLPIRLAPGSSTAKVLRFIEVNSLEGQKLVFNHPEAGKSLWPIEKFDEEFSPPAP